MIKRYQATNMRDQLLIFQKVYDFLLWLYPIINRIPKSHRLVLGRELEQLAITLLISVVKANKSYSTERSTLQQQISDDLDSIRILIRLTKDLKFMSVKQYTIGVEKINEIARMLTSWRKMVCSIYG